MSASIRHVAEPNVTPMIDVLLVLLIVFMVMVVQGRRTLDVQLPETCTGACGAGDAIVLEVLGAGDYRLNQRPVSRGALHQVLTNVYAGRPNKILSVTGRSGASYGQVMGAMDVARSAGVRVISTVPKGF
jgi:biopolymer transport protein TolR